MICETYLKSYMNVETAIETYLVSSFHDCLDLKKRTAIFIKRYKGI